MKSVVFTKTDKGLLMRSARLFDDQAKIEADLHGPVWAATEDGKEAKRRYDRLLRDARDMRALARRLEYSLPASASAPAVETGAGAAG